MKDRNYPVILGLKRNGKPTKACLGIRTKNGASYDVVIMGLKENQPDINNCTKEELTEALDGRIYTTLRFCNIEALDTMIKLLQDTKKMWEAVAVLNQTLQLDRKMEEHFCLIAMRSKKVIGIFKVNVGTINNSLVNTAGIFTRLLLCGATHFIIAHNHPSGNVSPSPEDEKVTENIKKISEMMGIIFCDHIIIGSGYFSFLEQNMM